MDMAFRTALFLCAPIIVAVCFIGIAMGVLQTIVQVQDQNVAFAPKLLVLAVVIAVGAPSALAVLEQLLTSVIRALPSLASTI